MSLLITQGVVLKSLNFGESDKIITILTDKLGKVDVIAHGAKRQKSQLLASTQLFCYADFMLYKGKNMYTLNQGSIIDSFQSILLDLDKLAYGSYFLELIDNLTEKESRNISLLALLLKSLYILIHDDVDLDLLKLTMDFKAISLSGYMPQLKACVKCRHNIEDSAYFSIIDGGLICRHCADLKNNTYFELNTDSIEFLWIIKNIKLEDLRNIKYDKNILTYIQDIIYKYILYYADKEFKSLNLINIIKK